MCGPLRSAIERNGFTGVARIRFDRAVGERDEGRIERGGNSGGAERDVEIEIAAGPIAFRQIQFLENDDVLGSDVDSHVRHARQRRQLRAVLARRGARRRVDSQKCDDSEEAEPRAPHQASAPSNVRAKSRAFSVAAASASVSLSNGSTWNVV